MDIDKKGILNEVFIYIIRIELIHIIDVIDKSKFSQWIVVKIPFTTGSIQLRFIYILLFSKSIIEWITKFAEFIVANVIMICE